MQHPLLDNIGSLRRRLRRRRLLYGLSRVMAWTVAGLLLLGSVDTVTRFQDPGLRLLLSLAAVALPVWSIRRWLVAPLLHQPGNVWVAQRIEDYFPHLGDRLSNAIGLLETDQSGPEYGSAALRRHVVQSCSVQCEKLPLSEAINSRPVQRAVLAAALVCALGGGVARLAPAATRAALLRLALPLRSPDRPLPPALAELHRSEPPEPAPPRVTLVQPDADIAVTAAAAIPVRIAVADELAVRDITLVFTRSDQLDNVEQLVPVWHASEPAGRSKPGTSPRASGSSAPAAHEPDNHGPTTTGRVGPDRWVVETVWDLQPLALPPGSLLRLGARARDVELRTAETPARRAIHIVSRQQWQRQIADRRDWIVRRLAETRTRQRVVRAETVAARDTLRNASTFTRTDLERLATAQWQQNEVDRVLTDSADGLPADIRHLLEEVAVNRADLPALTAPLKTLLAAVGALRQNHLVASQLALARAIKLSQAALLDAATADVPEAVVANLQESVKRQDALLREWDQLLEQIRSRASSRRRLQALRQIRAEQQAVRAATATAARQLYQQKTAAEADRGPVELESLARRQAALAQALETIERETEPKTDAESRPMTQDAQAEQAAARERGVAGQMRAAARHLARAELGAALTQQQLVDEALGQVLAGRRRAGESNVEETTAAPGGSAEPQPDAAGPFGQTVWEHLPKQVRDHIVPWSDESFLPKYRQETETYFRRLAEEPARP